MSSGDIRLSHASRLRLGIIVRTLGAAWFVFLPQDEGLAETGSPLQI